MVSTLRLRGTPRAAAPPPACADSAVRAAARSRRLGRIQAIFCGCCGYGPGSSAVAAGQRHRPPASSASQAPEPLAPEPLEPAAATQPLPLPLPLPPPPQQQQPSKPAAAATGSSTIVSTGGIQGQQQPSQPFAAQHSSGTAASNPRVPSPSESLRLRRPNQVKAQQQISTIYTCCCCASCSFLRYAAAAGPPPAGTRQSPRRPPPPARSQRRRRRRCAACSRRHARSGPGGQASWQCAGAPRRGREKSGLALGEAPQRLRERRDR